jgi:hypothetical protein
MGGATAQHSSQVNANPLGDQLREGMIADRNRQIDDAYSQTHEQPEPKPTAFAGTAKSGYNTGLTPSQEVAYQMYKANLGDQGTDNTYDLRGYWLSNVYNQGDGSHMAGAHFTDYWKKPNHQTFSTGSKYSTPEHMGGEWGQSNGRDTYEPSQWMEQDPARMAQLAQYMKQAEPNAVLVRRPQQ